MAWCRVREGRLVVLPLCPFLGRRHTVRGLIDIEVRPKRAWDGGSGSVVRYDGRIVADGLSVLDSFFYLAGMLKAGSRFVRIGVPELSYVAREHFSMGEYAVQMRRPRNAAASKARKTKRAKKK